MAHLFDPGPSQEPFLSLGRDYPEASVYPDGDFRLEWGPRLPPRADSTARPRLLVIGQDPAQHSDRAPDPRRRGRPSAIQGFLAKLGMDP